MQYLIQWCVLFCILLAGDYAHAENIKTCQFKPKDALSDYLNCLEAQNPRYAEKGRGYTAMGNRYEFGHGVARHFRQAALYYEMACDHADGNGCIYLARLYRTGRGVKRNKKKAKRLLHRALSLE